MDSGEYKCIASSNGQSSESNTIVIDVLPKASVFVELKTDHPNITLSGNPIRWEIDYHAYPKPDFLWFNEGRDVLVDSSKMYEGAKRFRLYEIHESGSITLNIEKPNVMDIGEYTLEANTSNGEKVASDTIKMFFSMPVEPRDMILTRSSNDLMIKENHSFRLNCEVKGYPKPDIYLEFQLCHSKGNCSDFLQLSRDESAPYNKLDQGTAKEPFHIFRESVTWNGRAQNQGYYRCVASNNLNSTTSSPLEFLVTDSDNATAYVSLEVVVNGKNQRSTSVVVLEGDDLIFRCIGNKMATNELSWMLNRNPLEEDLEKEWGLTVQKADSELSYISEIIIQNLTRMENFSLSCMEESVSLYSVTRLIQVKPMIAPKWKDGSSSPLRDYSLHEMGNLTMDCSADGTPPPEVTWYKDNVMLDKTLKHPEVIGNQISFHFLKTSDAGHYLCEVTNRAGTITSESYVKVFDPDAFVDTNVLIIVGVLVFILLVIMIFFSRKIYQDRKRALGLRLKEQKMFIEGDPGSLNPEIGLDQQAELLPYDSKYEMPRDSIIFDKLLGVGAFGRVYRATAINLVPGKACTTVAVKMMKSRTDSSQLKALRSEVKIMIHIGRHVNIVNLLGACSKDLASKGELLLLVEYCKYGNILDYMHRHRKEFINQINDDDKIDPSITDQRMRQRSGSGSRGRTSRGLKYARLSFNQDAVHYTNRQIPDSEHSNQTFLGQPSSPLLSPTMNGEVPGLFRNRNVSTSSSHHVTSDMSTLTYESSSGASDGYISSQVVGSNPANLCSKVLLCWAFQIARGMEYLAFKKVLHGDLAARNVLLAEDNIVKISDFGLAKDIYKDKNYKKKSGGPVPVKWLALECLRDCVFSTQSDVWSFGVVLWEIFSLGQNPYPGVEFDENFIVKLEKGVRLEQPRYSTYALYRIMLDCWNSEPLERPTFSNLEQRLGEILGEAEKQYYLELNQPYQVDNNESSFLNLLQSPDYSAKVHGVHPNLDADGYEMPFSPSPFGVNALPEAEIQNLHPQTPRLTSLQMEFIQQETGMDSGSSAGTYLSMSSPTRKNQNVFKFDHEAVASMAMQDNEILQEYCEGIEEPCDVYLNMDSGPKINRSISHESQQNTPLRISVEDVSEIYTSPNHQDNGSSCVALRHKIIRTVSENEKHDSGLYSPTACMQTNPNYMIMNSFSDTDESNCLTKEDAQDMENCHLDQPQYINYDAVKFTSKSVPREYMKEGRCDEEYVNLLPSEGCRGRTISEASSGLGSIAEETPPESRAKPDYLKSPVMGSPIIEEPVAA
ncbi:vascular endothelial growth factor receptor 1-like isoform X1 [Panulirus ornatus]|uniref:vascular endothelial growth factor receptor 1-like isoform X1 n=3 Tax=Panulirus ornatus TaxID=150431 RepID=UPI003A888285